MKNILSIILTVLLVGGAVALADQVLKGDRLSSSSELNVDNLMENLSDDTTPELGGNLDIGIYKFTAGANDVLERNGTNLMLGNDVGNASLTGSTRNFLAGDVTGNSLAGGDNNVVIGPDSGIGLVTNNGSVIIGYRAAQDLSGSGTNDNGLVAIGWDAGADALESDNVYIGNGAGKWPTGGGNVSIGYQSMQDNDTVGSEQTTAVGYRSGRYGEGDNNTFLGYQAGEGQNAPSTEGSSNVFVGHKAGRQATGSNSIFIGASAAESSSASNTFRVGDDNVTTWEAAPGTTLASSSGDFTITSFVGQMSLKTSDPCGSLSEGAMFYNDTSNYMCYCDGTNDVQVHSPATACF